MLVKISHYAVYCDLLGQALFKVYTLYLVAFICAIMINSMCMFVFLVPRSQNKTETSGR